MSELEVRFWGTRGSIPTPGPHTEKYGGNTTCLELRHEDTIMVIDAGSGIRLLSKSWSRELADRPIRAHLFFTHLHWDHIQGFPFFAPAYEPHNVLTIYGEEKPAGSIEHLLGGQMQGAYFPVPFEAMKASMSFDTVVPDTTFSVDAVTVKTFPLPHPGGCLGYRFEVEGSTFVLATDCELDRVALNQQEIQARPEASRHYEAGLLAFLRDAHVLVIDCQYSDDEYRIKRGWGHNSMTTVADLCKQVRPGTVALFHHDPESDDQTVGERVDEMNERLEQMESAPIVIAARERMALRVAPPLRPVAVRS